MRRHLSHVADALSAPPACGRGGRGYLVSRRLLVIGAHSADFVWRAGGAIAACTRNGGTAQVDRALLRRARRVRRALEGGGPDRRERQEGPPRGGREGRRCARRRVPGDGLRRLPAARRRGPAPAQVVDAIREFEPDTLVTHTDTDPFNPDHPIAYEVVERARVARRRRGREQRVPSIAPPQLFLFEPHQPELCNFTPTTFVDITEVIEAKKEAMAAMEAQKYLRPTTPSRRAARQPRPPRLRATRACATPRRSSACCRNS